MAREFEVALPSELSDQERQNLAHDLARELMVKHQCAVDVAIHAPGGEGDNRNHHAHILLSTRRLTKDGFGEKTRELDDRKTGQVEEWRARWAELSNRALERAGHRVRIDHRSLKAQGVEREPTTHLGPTAVGYERRTKQASRRRLDAESDVADRQAQTAAEAEQARELAKVESEILAAERDLQEGLAKRDRQRLAQAPAQAPRKPLEAPQKPLEAPQKPLASPSEAPPVKRSRFSAEAMAERAAIAAQAPRPVAPPPPAPPPAQPRPQAAAPAQAPEAPQPPAAPTLTERLAASLAALLAWVASLGGTHQQANTTRSDCHGPVVKLDDLHAVQRTNRTAYTIHRLSDLDQIPALDQPKTEIHYRDGKGTVTGPAQGLQRGR